MGVPERISDNAFGLLIPKIDHRAVSNSSDAAVVIEQWPLEGGLQ
jgi:hypothetical protein